MGIQTHPWPCTKFETILNYTRPYQKQVFLREKLLFWEGQGVRQGFPYIPGCSGTRCVDQALLEFRDQPACSLPPECWT